jgi:zona occludens toxin
MISLTSGLPGAGKTLWTIAHVEALRKKENREVFYHGIKDLTLPWTHLEDPKKWFECPPGAIIVIDEAQHHFPLRGSSQAKPPHVERTATHRHDGHDIFLISQHPGKIDSAVRKDIEVHRHLMRKFGSNFAGVHQWQGVRETCDKTRKDSVSSTWRYPKEAFTWYKSAEVHTHKLKVPTPIIVAVCIILGIGVFWYLFLGKLSRGEAFGAPGKPQGGDQVAAAAAPGRHQERPKTPQEYLADITPRIDGLQHTAPVYDGLTKPVRVPVPAACIQWAGKGCKCFTQTGTPYPTTEQICTQIVKDGVFLDFEPNPVQVQASQNQPGQVAPGQAAPAAAAPVAPAADTRSDFNFL